MPSRPVVMLICAGAALLICAGLLAAGLRIKADLSFFLPTDTSAASGHIVEQLRAGPTSGLMLLAISGGDAERRRRASDELTRQLTDTAGFQFVSNGTPRFDKADLDVLLEYRYILNPALTPSQFSPAELRAALARALGLLRTSLGAAVKRLLAADPTLRSLDIAEHWAALSTTRGVESPWESKDGARALIVALPRGEAFDFETASKTRQLIDRAFAAVAGDSNLRLEVGGPGVIALGTRDQIKREAQWLTIASAVLVGMFLFIMFRSLLSLAAMIIPIAFAFVAGATAVQLAFGYVHGVTLAFGSILIGVAVDYPIHLLAHSKPPGGARESVVRIWPTIWLGVLTTIVAFLPMFFSSFPGLSQLGVFAAVGLLAAAVATRWVLPATIPSSLRAPNLPVLNMTRDTSSAGRRGLVMGVIVAVVSAAVFVGTADRIWDNDVRNLSPIPRAKLDFDRAVRADLRAPDVRRLIVVVGNSPEEVLREQETLSPKLLSLLSAGGGFDMAARYLPSMRAQTERTTRLPDAATLRANLGSAVAGLPFKAELFTPFLKAVERVRTGEPVSFNAFAGGRLGWRITPLLFQSQGRWIGPITLAGVTEPTAIAAFVAGLKKPSVTFIDLKDESDRLMASYREEALWWLAGGALAALVILALGIRSFAGVLRVAFPVAASVVLTVALLLAAGGPLSFIHIMALLLVAGLGLDYALFLNRNLESEQDGRRTVTSVLVGNITTVVVFTVLAFSELPVLNNMGQSVALGAVLSILLAFLFRRRQFAK